MTWSVSQQFRRNLQNALGNALAMDWDTDVQKAALFNNSITPDNDVTTDVLMGYNGASSQWTTTNEVIDTTGGADWPAAGVALASKTIDVATADLVKLDAADTASGATADIANAFGCLVYDDSIANKPGWCYNYFGGGNQVTNGTFTIVWHANGVLSYAL